MTSLFDDTLNWYKGNLHTHTTLSDGLKTPEEAAAIYKAAGYDFIAVTDHLRYRESEQREDFVTLDGIECHDNRYRPGRVCHITGIGFASKPPEIPGDTPPQRIIDTLLSCGAWVTLAHPAWSLMHNGDTLELEGYHALEIYNGISDTYAGRGYSDVYADVLASAGRFPLLTAVDDSHFHDRDALLGYVMLKAEALTREALLKNLRQGHFYATTGPRIRRVEMGGGSVRVECDGKMARIRFMSNAFFSRFRTVDDADRAEYRLMPEERYLRVVCEDGEGRAAWTGFLPMEACRKP